jgi:ABC-type multidrug transport system permease subunit
VSELSLSLSAEAEEPRRRRLQTGAVRALIRRDWSIQLSYRTAFLSDIAFGLLNLSMYRFLSEAVRVRSGTSLGGAPTYFAFAAVGLTLTVVLQAAINGLSSRVREEQLTGTLETTLAQPISSIELALGLTGFPFLFALVRAFVYLLIAALVLGLSLAHCNWLGLLASFVVSGFAFAGIGITLAALVLVFKRAGAAGSLGTFALGLLGGAVFPISVLPGWLHPVALIVPTRFAFNAVRDALFGLHTWVTPAAILLGIGVALLAVSFVIFELAVRRVIAIGTVNQY